MATHSSILAWRIPWTEEPGRLQSMGSQVSDTTQQLNYQTPAFYLPCIDSLILLLTYLISLCFGFNRLTLDMCLSKVQL